VRPAYLEIDAKAFQHNLKKIKSQAPNSKILAVLKANAYGHGIANIIPHVQTADAIGVSCLEEALEIKKMGCLKSIVLMEGFLNKGELTAIQEHDFEIVIHQPEQVNYLQNANLKKPLKVWIKINTGMCRLGFAPDQFNHFYEILNQLSYIQQPITIMTHFADADDLQSPATKEQLHLFNELTQHLPNPKSLANSAGIFARPESHQDWIRPGIALYGISPFENKTGAALDLQPVMTLHSALISIQDLPKGSKIGYGGTWQCPEAMRVGVVAMGYGDGYPRHIQNHTPVLLNGKEVSIIGRVSMDMITLDLRSQPCAKIGDPVIFWGKGLPVESIAACAQTSPYELVCQVTQRLKVR
jgi:alanine racemase